MILIGQYDSPFVRRVGIALRLYGMEFEHRPWSVFGDAEKIKPFNPLIQVPTLVLDDGFVLTDSMTIMDYLDGLVAAPLVPRTEPARRLVLKIVALASGLSDKAVSLFYERHLHDLASDVWEARCLGQIGGVLAALEADRAKRKTAFWFGDTLGFADIAVACALRHAAESHPDVIDLTRFPALTAHCETCEALPVCKAISQPFIFPT